VNFCGFLSWAISFSSTSFPINYSQSSFHSTLYILVVISCTFYISYKTTLFSV
jgi:hypothetical protein